MCAGSIFRSLFVAGLLAVVNGCFALDELDKANALASGPATAREKAAATAGAGKGGAATSAAAKPGAGAAAAVNPVDPNAKGWWQTARTLGSEESDAGIARCQLSGRSEFMLRDDCVARGGVPK